MAEAKKATTKKKAAAEPTAKATATKAKAEPALSVQKQRVAKRRRDSHYG